MTFLTCARMFLLILSSVLLHQAGPLQAACIRDEEFQCSNGFQCVKSWHFCDGDIDCLDGSDEFGCQTELQTSQYLIVADQTRGNLFKVAVDGSGMVPLLPHDIGRYPVTVALDESSGTVYWTDVVQRTINKCSLTDRRAVSRPIFEGAFPTEAVLEGLALNTVDKIIFYGDAGDIGKIGSIGFTGTNHNILLQKTGMKPRTLILDPSNRYLYWTDWGEDPAINVASMDDLTHHTYTTLVEKEATFYPNALAIDFSQKVMFWCDAHLGAIEMALLDGTKQRTLLYLDEPNLVYGMFLTPKYLYFTDWKKRSVQQMNRKSYAVNSLQPSAFHRLCGITYFSAPTVSSTTAGEDGISVKANEEDTSTKHLSSESATHSSGSNRRTASQQAAADKNFDGSDVELVEVGEIVDSENFTAVYERFKRGRTDL